MNVSLNERMTNWIRSNLSPDTFLPLSFDIPLEQKEYIYKRMGEPDSVAGIIERVIVEEGLDIYDGAVAQIVLTMLGKETDLSLAQVPVDIYWEGKVGELCNIRAGYPANSFVYDLLNPEAVSSDLSLLGRRGFIFRIINANGRYQTEDPLDGKSDFDEFPTWPNVHWEDWKPIAGENAWVVIAAMHLYHKKYYNAYSRKYQNNEGAVELKLAEELARAALFLQAENGAIRMAPMGTHRETEGGEEQMDWWYNEISSENNISWYAAFRMLYEVTRKFIYKEAMDNIEFYFKRVWSAEENYFYQGMHFVNGKWEANQANFALDVQTWAIDAFGPEKIDLWFGEGAAYKIWKTAKRMSGSFNQKGDLLGVGYIHEHDRISVEWTAGAIMAARSVSSYYAAKHPSWSMNALVDSLTMREGLESLRHDISYDMSAYSYSSRRGWIPFGWFSHDPEVMSLASTGWVLFVDHHFNPFHLPIYQANYYELVLSGVGR